jgi:hypothetical protein
MCFSWINLADDYEGTQPAHEITKQDIADAEICLILDLHQRMVIRVSPQPRLSDVAVIPNDLKKSS